MTKNVQIAGSKITDWDSFHDLFAEVFGFPGFYGRNMNAWNDCMTYLAVPEEGMTSVHVMSTTPNHRAGVDAGFALPFAFQSHWPGTTRHGR
jgi:RNAse (barnase) inhibitor barstar